MNGDREEDYELIYREDNDPADEDVYREQKLLNETGFMDVAKDYATKAGVALQMLRIISEDLEDPIMTKGEVKEKVDEYINQLTN